MRDFSGRGVFHQVVDRHAAVAGQPAAEVVDADVDVVAQAGFGDRRLALNVDTALWFGRATDLLVPLVEFVAEHVDELNYDVRNKNMSDSTGFGMVY